MELRPGRLGLLLALVGTIAAPSVGWTTSNPNPTQVVLYKIPDPRHQNTANIECALGIRARAALTNGLAARLSDIQVVRLLANRWIYRVVPDPSSYVVEILSRDPAVVERRVNELERKLRFKSDFRYNRAFRGFAAALGWRQLAALNGETDVSLTADPFRYIVVYDPGVDVDARTNELEAKYGFTSTSRFRGGPWGFAASLGKGQLAGVSNEPDINYIERDGWGIVNPPYEAVCNRPSAAERTQLTRAFLRDRAGNAHVRKVRVTRYRGWQYALGTFSGPGIDPTSQPERFLRRLPGPWHDKGPTGGTICIGQMPREAIEVWLLIPSGPVCYAVR